MGTSDHNAGRVIMRWTSILSMGSSNIPSCFMLQKLELSAGLMGLLACMQTLPFILFTRFHLGMNSSWDNFIPLLIKHWDECHPGMKWDKNFHVRGLPGMKVPCVNCVCEGMGEIISTQAV